MLVIFKVIILGIVEGITEFLPISSTGHLIVVNQFVNLTGSFANMFDIIIQLGAILSVVVVFWHKLYPFSKNKTDVERNETWGIWKKTIVGVVPALILGALFGDQIEKHLFNPMTVAFSLFVGGIIIILIERKHREGRIDSVTNLGYKTAFLIGLIQCLAMIPGTSRSAATIIGAILLGTTRLAATEYSFFLAIPTMVAASGYSLLKVGMNVTGTQIELLIIGFVVSFLVAWVVIKGFLKYISNHDFQFFGYYRILLAVFILIYFTILR